MKRRVFCTSAIAALTAASTALPTLLASAAEAVTGSGPDLSARGLDGSRFLLPDKDVADLQRRLRGALLRPGQDNYEQARRVWNGAFDRHPALIARCAGASDVIETVSFARAHGLLTAVRGGGHSFSGQSTCEGGLVIDLSPMKSVRVDPGAMRVRVEPGVLLGELDRECQAFNLATPAGTISHTGVAGLTLGGGIGRLARKYGLACDNLVAGDVVTANGRLVRANAQDNPDLLWGLRGGGGNFGVVTSFEYRLHAVKPDMFGGQLVFPYADARPILEFFSGFALQAPDELNVDARLVTLPDGTRILGFDVCYNGAVADGERLIRPLRQFRKPLLDGLGPAKYVELQRAGDGNVPHGRNYYVKAGFVPRIDAPLSEASLAQFEALPAPAFSVHFVHLGGAIARVSSSATAFPHREAGHSVILLAAWDGQGDPAGYVERGRKSWQTLEPFTAGFYVNDVGADDSERRLRDNYGANLERLTALKSKFDPTNLFRLNANVRPRV